MSDLIVFESKGSPKGIRVLNLTDRPKIKINLFPIMCTSVLTCEVKT